MITIVIIDYNMSCQFTVISKHLRLDKGTETGDMATIHAYLRKDHDDDGTEDTVHYGTSTTNKVLSYPFELSIFLATCKHTIYMYKLFLVSLMPPPSRIQY